MTTKNPEKPILEKYNDLLKKYKTLEEENIKHKFLQKNTKDGILFIDNYGKIQEINDAFEFFFGGKKKEIIGKNILMLPIKLSLSPNILFKHFQDSLKNKTSNLILNFINKKGEFINLECSSSIIKKNNKPIGILILAKNKNAELSTKKIVTNTHNLYKTIVENSNDAIYIYAKNSFQFVNNKLCQLSGYNKSDLINQNIWSIVHPLDIERLQNCSQNRINGEKLPSQSNARVICKNGEIKYCAFSVSLTTYQGETSIIGQVRDITLETEVQNNIKDELKRIATIFNSIDAFVYVTDMQTNTILFANDNVKKDIGKDCIGKKCWQLIHYEKTNPCSFCNNKLLVDKNGNINKSIKWEYYNPRIKKWFHIKDQAIKWHDGRIVRLEIATDITERKQLLQSVSLSNRKFKSIVENAPVGIMYYNKQGIIIDCNNLFIDLVGSNKEKLIGFNMTNQLNDLDLINQIKLSLKTGTAYYEGKYKSTISKKTNSLRILLKGLKNEKEEIYAGMAIVEDISESIIAKNELIASHQTFKNIYDHAFAAIYILDMNGKFIDINKGALEMYGYSYNEIIGKTPRFLSDLKKTNFVEFEKTYAKVVAGEPQHTEFWGKRKNGESFPKFIRLTKGKYFGKDVVIVFAIDTTQIKKAEKDLKESEESYRIITETAEDLISTISVEKNPIFTYVSPSHFNALGYDSKDLVGDKLFNIIHPDDLPLVSKLLSISISKNIYPNVNKKDSSNKIFQVRVSTKEKKFKVFESRVKLQNDKFILISRDVTERLEIEKERSSTIWFLKSLDLTEKALRSNLNIETVIKNVLIIVKNRFRCTSAFITRIDDSFKKCNLKYESLFNKNIKCFDCDKTFNSKFIQNLIREENTINNYNIINPEEKSTSLLLITLKPNQGNPWIFGICENKQDYEWKEIEKKLLIEVGNRLTDSINIMHYLESIKNNQEDLKAKSQQVLEINKDLKISVSKAEESDKLKSLFLANMSHEIRTPMNSIVGFSDLMQKSFTSNEERIEYAEIINTSSKLLLTLISDIVDISKIESDEITIFYHQYHLNTIIKDLFNLHNISSTNGLKENVNFKYSLGLNDSECTITTDEVRLKQVINNLLGNAIKFTKKGEIEFGYELEDKNTLKFFIHDTGIGIKKDDLKYIFKRFGQALSTNKAIFGGAGLGLSISEGLIKLFGGKIWAESTYKKGTSFYFTLPLKNPIIINNLPSKIKINTKYPDWTNYKFLIVDDDISTNKYFRAVLKNTNAKLEFATTGEEGIKKIMKNPNFDIVLMDMRLPKISGIEATKKIKLLFPDLPIIAQTAYALSGDKQKAIDGGCNDYISKPIHLPKLIEIINANIKPKF